MTSPFQLELADVRLIDVRSINLDESSLLNGQMYSKPENQDLKIGVERPSLPTPNLQTKTDTEIRSTLKAHEHSCKLLTNLTFLALPVLISPISLPTTILTNPEIVVDSIVELALLSVAMTTPNSEELNKLDKISQLKDKEKLVAESLSLALRHYGLSDGEMDTLSKTNYILDLTLEMAKQVKLYHLTRKIEPVSIATKALRKPAEQICEIITRPDKNIIQQKSERKENETNFQFGADLFREELEWIEKQKRDLERIRFQDRHNLLVQKNKLELTKLEKTKHEKYLDPESFGDPITADFNDFISSDGTMIA